MIAIMSLLGVSSGVTGGSEQAVAHAASAKRRVSFTIGLKCEVFIYFAVNFLKEAFQGFFLRSLSRVYYLNSVAKNEKCK